MDDSVTSEAPVEHFAIDENDALTRTLNKNMLDVFEHEERCKRLSSWQEQASALLSELLEKEEFKSGALASYAEKISSILHERTRLISYQNPYDAGAGGSADSLDTTVIADEATTALPVPPMLRLISAQSDHHGFHMGEATPHFLHHNTPSLSAPDLHLVMLFSAPLVVTYTDASGHMQLHPMDSVNYDLERKLVVDSLEGTGRMIKYKTQVATVDHLRQCLDDGPVGLHFSGHGLKGSEGGVDEDFLVFEDGQGRAHFVNCATLGGLLNASQRRIEFVFVASCHSRLVGEVFLRAGVSHVVCVRRDEKVMDKASILFARAFYHALFTGLHSVAEAFRIGKAVVHADASVPQSEAEKFILLPELETDAAGHQIHTRRFFCDLPEGSPQNCSSKPMFGHLFSKEEHFIGRHVDMQEVIRLISLQRLVTVRGPPGIGKTSLSKAVAHYMNDRTMFKDGVLYASLRGAQSTETVISRLCLCIKDQCVDEGISSYTETDLEKYILKVLREKDLCLVMDNVEDPLNAETVPFRECLQKLVENLPSVKFLLTSRSAVGGGLSGVTEKVYTVHSLDAISAARLFEKRCPRPLDMGELRVSVVGNPNGTPLSRFRQRTLGVGDTALMLLSKHPVLNILGGHPQAISLAAPLLSDRSLKELYELLNARMLDVLQVADIPLEERNQVNTLVASLQVSIDHLRKRNVDAVRFFSLMGLLPSGAREVDFDVYWGSGWRDLADALMRASLIGKKQQPKSDERYSTFPFVTLYAQRILQANDRKMFCVRVCRHLAEICESLFMVVGNLTAESDAAYDILSAEESNFWSCLQRYADDETLGSLTDDNVSASLSSSASALSSSPSASSFSANATIGSNSGDSVAYSVANSTTSTPSGTSSSTPPGLSVIYFPSSSPSHIGKVASFFASCLFLVGRVRDGQRAADIGMSIVNKLSDTMSQANLRKCLGSIFMRFKQLDEAQREFSKARVLYKAVSSHLGLAATSACLGFLHNLKGNMAGSLHCYETAVTYYQKLNHKYGESIIHRWLGTLKGKLRREKAAEHFAAARMIKRGMKSVHNSGRYVQRWMGDSISLHIEIATREDKLSLPVDTVKPKRLQTAAPTATATRKPVTGTPVATVGSAPTSRMSNPLPPRHVILLPPSVVTVSNSNNGNNGSAKEDILPSREKERREKEKEDSPLHSIIPFSAMLDRNEKPTVSSPAMAPLPRVASLLRRTQRTDSQSSSSTAANVSSEERKEQKRISTTAGAANTNTTSATTGGGGVGPLVKRKSARSKSLFDGNEIHRKDKEREKESSLPAQDSVHADGMGMGMGMGMGLSRFDSTTSSSDLPSEGRLSSISLQSDSLRKSSPSLPVTPLASSNHSLLNRQSTPPRPSSASLTMSRNSPKTSQSQSQNGASAENKSVRLTPKKSASPIVSSSKTKRTTKKLTLDDSDPEPRRSSREREICSVCGLAMLASHECESNKRRRPPRKRTDSKGSATPPSSLRVRNILLEAASPKGLSPTTTTTTTTAASFLPEPASSDDLFEKDLISDTCSDISDSGSLSVCPISTTSSSNDVCSSSPSSSSFTPPACTSTSMSMSVPASVSLCVSASASTPAVVFSSSSPIASPSTSSSLNVSCVSVFVDPNSPLQSASPCSSGSGASSPKMATDASSLGNRRGLATPSSVKTPKFGSLQPMNAGQEKSATAEETATPESVVAFASASASGSVERAGRIFQTAVQYEYEDLHTPSHVSEVMRDFDFDIDESEGPSLFLLAPKAAALDSPERGVHEVSLAAEQEEDLQVFASLPSAQKSRLEALVAWAVHERNEDIEEQQEEEEEGEEDEEDEEEGEEGQEEEVEVAEANNKVFYKRDLESKLDQKPNSQTDSRNTSISDLGDSTDPILDSTLLRPRSSSDIASDVTVLHNASWQQSPGLARSFSENDHKRLILSEAALEAALGVDVV